MDKLTPTPLSSIKEPSRISSYDGGEATLNEDPISTPLRNISIEPLDSGFIVRVGCQSIAVETKEKLLFNLTSYINDPAAYEKLYYSNNKKLL